LRFLSSAPPETHGLVAVDEHGYPRPIWLSWSSRPLQSFSADQVAPCWLPALPPRRWNGLGVFPVPLSSQDQGPGSSSRGVRVPFRADLRLGCPRSGPAIVACATTACRPSSGFASLGVLAPLSTTTPGAPVHPPRP